MMNDEQANYHHPSTRYYLPLMFIIIQQSLLYRQVQSMCSPGSDNNVINIGTIDNVILHLWLGSHEEQHAALNALFFPVVVSPRCTVL